jgi:3-oxoacyl-[acyl-carrier protein] reductase
MDVNVLTTFLCCQAVAPGMIARKRGAIINLTSLAAHNGGGPGASVYAAGKAAVLTLTKAYAKELAPHGIRVNAVSPGLIGGTPFHGRFTPPEAFAAAVKTIPLGRAGVPEDVARVIAFLAGEDAAFLAGETIEINGGMFMR